MALTDPRLAALYDVDNPDGPDHDYFRATADRIDARNIVDLGCGTGILTVTLTGPERTVTGIDPDRGMLDVARHRLGHDQVTWINGDSGAIRQAMADLVVMSGNVAQHIGPAAWPVTLNDISAGLQPDGRLCFETRNPSVEAWREWTRSNTYSERNTPNGRLIEWLETSAPDADGTVLLKGHNIWAETGEELVVTQPLTFRSAEQVTADLQAAGLIVTGLHGGWLGEAADSRSPLLVFEATKG